MKEAILGLAGGFPINIDYDWLIEVILYFLEWNSSIFNFFQGIVQF